MPRLAANLSTMFADAPFLHRFERAAKAGFDAVEFQFAYVFDPAEIAARLSDTGLRLALFNMPAGDWEHGDRGLASRPARREEFRTGVGQAIDLALELGCKRLHMLAGVVTPDDDEDALRQTYVDNLRYAAQFCATAGIEVLIEPISRESFPAYFLSGLDMAADLIDEAGEENVFLQYDLYHRRFVGEDLVAPYLKHADRIRHVQVAGWPGRHEPDVGVLDWPAAFAALDAANYAGFVGCEYWPAGRTEDGLGWARPWLGVAT
ncbi:MAG: TIM barrel protein [Mesorhizobium sp.]|nr:TIM barrel protein [Mesorhizobium sp.]